MQLPDGTIVKVPLPIENRPDNPFKANIGIDPGPYGVRWTDSPYLRDRSSTRPPAMVVGADLTWTFQFKGMAPDGTAGCGGGFTLHFKFDPGTDPNRGWSITDEYTF